MLFFPIYATVFVLVLDFVFDGFWFVCRPFVSWKSQKLVVTIFHLAFFCDTRSLRCSIQKLFQLFLLTFKSIWCANFWPSSLWACVFRHSVAKLEEVMKHFILMRNENGSSRATQLFIQQFTSLRHLVSLCVCASFFSPYFNLCKNDEFKLFIVIDVPANCLSNKCLLKWLGHWPLAVRFVGCAIKTW